MMMDAHKSEVEGGDRFEFGKNWKAFLSILDEERIEQAEASIKEYLKLDTLNGLSFLDCGCGSGLFSLAAYRLGAKVYSFDYDPQSVACTRELKRRYCKEPDQWEISRGSVLDKEYLNQLGDFDIVYSWGVLHHTGDMWRALENVSNAVAKGGRLYIAIYNHQERWSEFNKKLKYSYNKSPKFGKWLIAGGFISVQIIKGFIKDIILFRNPVKRYKQKKKSRGMSMWYDWIDWIGGYPFEVAKPEEIFAFYNERGFSLEKLRTMGAGHGCNEFLFVKEGE